MSGVAGAYGLALPDVGPDIARLLLEAPREWPEWRLEHRPTGHEGWEREELSPERARLALSGGGWVGIDAHARTAVFYTPDPPTHAVAHPYLGLVASVAAHWRGWNSFHAGAVVIDGQVWGLLGGRESGKTTTLGFLSRRPGVEVLCDDVLVLDGHRRACGGPRCIDLREDAAAFLGAGEPIGVVGARERWRAPLRRVDPALAVRGWIDLRWGQETVVERPGAAERLGALGGALALRLGPSDPSGLLELSALPFLTFTRARGLDRVDASLERLLREIVS